MPALFPSDWLADAPYEDRDLGVLKAGKESEVYLVSRVGPTRMWWESHEWATLQRLDNAGVTVPPPVERVEHGYRMAFIGDGDRAAPRLSDVDLDLGTARRVWRELQREIRLILDAELVHGDLSAFNVLWWHERPVIIDFSQSVDAVVHPAARDLLRRDVERTAGYFRRQGVAVDLDAALALVGDSPARFAHQVLSS